MKKFSLLFLALLAAMTIVFTGCKQNDEGGESANPSILAVFEGEIQVAESTPAVVTLTFYSDKTWVNTMTSEGKTENLLKGTYEGDINKDGTIEIIQSYGWLNGEWQSLPESMTVQGELTSNGQKLSADGVTFTRK